MSTDNLLELLSALPGDVLIPVRWIRDALEGKGDGEPYAGRPDPKRRPDHDYPDDAEHADPGGSHD